MQDPRFLTQIKENIELATGKGYYQRLTNQHFKHYFNQRNLLSSVYNEQNQSTNYAIQLRARAYELARFRLLLEEVMKDQYVPEARSEFLYKNFGSYLQIEHPYFFEDESDEFYRDFIIALMAVVLRGSKKSAIIDGLRIFTRGLPFDVTEIYLDCRERKFQKLRMDGFELNPNPLTKIESLVACDKSDTNIFLVRFDMDARPPGSKLNYIVQGVEYFLDILKPAHTAYIIKWAFGDEFNIRSNCKPKYDLIMGETIPSEIRRDNDGTKIVLIEDFLITLEDGTILCVVDNTRIIGFNDTEILLSSLQVGDKIAYEGIESPGRFQYARPLQELPPDFIFTSKGYIRSPFVNELSQTIISSNVFQMFVLKQEQEGMPVLEQTSGVCDTLKTRIFTWFYDDFRKCGAYRENYKENEAVQISPITQTIQLSNYPLTDGSGGLATAADIVVTVNGNLVQAVDVKPLIGVVELDNSVGVGDDIQVSYHWSVNAVYPLIHNMEGSVYNKAAIPGNYTITSNDAASHEPRKINWKLEGFSLMTSSLLNSTFSLLHHHLDPYRHRHNDAHVVKNYTDKACRVFNKTARLGLSTEGECLNYPTPPVQLRFSAEARLPDPWKLVKPSDVLNENEEVLNDFDFILNNVFRQLDYSIYGKRYAFTDIEKSECGGERTLYPFCEDVKTTIGFSDEKKFIFPEIDFIRHADDETLLNQNPHFGIEYTGVIFKVREKFEDTVDPVQDSNLKIHFGTLFDTYKNPPMYVLIHNDAETEYKDGVSHIPVLGFEDGEVLNDPDFVLNQGLLNNQGPVVVGWEENEKVIAIPPSRVHAGTGEDSVPPEMKDQHGSNDYVYFGKRTFDEELLWNISYQFDDTYLSPMEKYSLNTFGFILNHRGAVLNSGNESFVIN